MVTFIQNSYFADFHTMPLPGRMPNMKDYSVMMLPSDMTKSGIWKNYVDCCAENGLRAIGLTKFKDIRALYLQSISVMRFYQLSVTHARKQQSHHEIVRLKNA